MNYTGKLKFRGVRRNQAEGEIKKKLKKKKVYSHNHPRMKVLSFTFKKFFELQKPHS